MPTCRYGIDDVVLGEVRAASFVQIAQDLQACAALPLRRNGACLWRVFHLLRGCQAGTGWCTAAGTAVPPSPAPLPQFCRRRRVPARPGRVQHGVRDSAHAVPRSQQQQRQREPTPAVTLGVPGRPICRAGRRWLAVSATVVMHVCACLAQPAGAAAAPLLLPHPRLSSPACPRCPSVPQLTGNPHRPQRDGCVAQGWVRIEPRCASYAGVRHRRRRRRLPTGPTREQRAWLAACTSNVLVIHLQFLLWTDDVPSVLSNGSGRPAGSLPPATWPSCEQGTAGARPGCPWHCGGARPCLAQP